MTTAPDQLIPYSALTFTSDHSALAPSGVFSYDAIGALLLHVLARTATRLAGGRVQPVSWSMDVTGSPKGTGLQLESRLDRHTRSLIFISGTAKETSGPCLRVTAIYRIEAP